MPRQIKSLCYLQLPPTFAFNNSATKCQAAQPVSHENVSNRWAKLSQPPAWAADWPQSINCGLCSTIKLNLFPVQPGSFPKHVCCSLSGVETRNSPCVKAPVHTQCSPCTGSMGHSTPSLPCSHSSWAEVFQAPHWNTLFYFHSSAHTTPEPCLFKHLTEIHFYFHSLLQKSSCSITVFPSWLLSSINTRKAQSTWIIDAYSLHNPTTSNEMLEAFNVEANNCYL